MRPDWRRLIIRSFVSASVIFCGGWTATADPLKIDVEVDLSRTKITKQGLAKLIAARPKLSISADYRISPPLRIE